MTERVNSVFFVFVLTVEVAIVWSLDLWGLQLHDRFSFWAAAKAFIDQQNPYELQEVMNYVATCCNATPPEGIAIERIWGVPIIFTLISWFGLFNFEGFIQAHVVFTCILMGVSVYLLRSLFVTVYGVRPSLSLEGAAILSFFPFIVTPIVGPAVPYSLLGISIFLYRRLQNPDSTTDFWGGLALSLFLIKPHVISLLAAQIFFLSLKRRSFRTLLGVATGVAILIAVGSLINPALWGYYFGIVREFPVNLYLTPTLASVLGNQLGLHGWLRFIPFFLGFVLLGYATLCSDSSKVISSQSELTKLALATVLAVICAPYLWVYDFIVALPALFLALYTIDSLHRFRATALVLIVSHMMLFTVAAPMNYSVWYPFVLLALTYQAHKLQTNSVS